MEDDEESEQLIRNEMKDSTATIKGDIVNDNLECGIDGNCLCITRKDFINLQESEAVFVKITHEQMMYIKKLQSIVLPKTEWK